MGALLTKFTKLWASAIGAVKSNPDDAIANKVIDGAKDNEQLPFDWHNWELDRLERSIQDIALHSSGPMPPGLTRDQLVQKHFSSSGQDGRAWSLMYDDFNTINMGSTNDILDLALYYPDGTNEAPVLLILSEDGKIYWYNTNTWVNGNSGTLGNLPSGSGESWEPRQFVSDNEYVYVEFIDTGASTGRRIQAYSLVDWTKRSGWPSTGIGFTYTNSYDDRMIDINNTYICFLDSQPAITASSTATLNLIRKDNGTVDDSGAGDATTGSSYKGHKALCTDGTYVFFVIYVAGSQSKVCSADLADLTSGCGGSGWPTAPIPINSLECGDLVYTGSLVLSLWYQLDSDAANGFLQAHAVSDASHSWFSLGGDFVDYYGYNMAFDGKRVWLRLDQKNSDKPILLAINPGAFSKHTVIYQSGIAEQINTAIEKVYAIDDSASYTLTDEYKRMVFDGSAMWAMTYGRSGTRYVRRTPNLG